MFKTINFALSLMLVATSDLGAQTPPAMGFPVTPQVGPWMICVASYRGDDALLKTEEMCQELRSIYKVPAFAFNHAEEKRQQEAQRVAALREQHKSRLREAGLPEDTKTRIKTVRIEDQFAVLVGGFKDDVAARRYLDDIRKLKPSEKLQLTAFVPGPDGKMHQQAVNPFQSAFVCRNPTVPAEKTAQDQTPTARLKEYNADESFSLLKCSKPWTLVVKSYSGAAAVESQSASKSVMAKLVGAKSGDLLNANAKMAHQLAESLRMKKPKLVGLGFDAYVLHTEYSSYVTIGGFDGPDDPNLLQMQQLFISEMNNPKTSLGRINIVGNVQFFPQPMPMAVPQVK